MAPLAAFPLSIHCYMNHSREVHINLFSTVVLCALGGTLFDGWPRAAFYSGTLQLAGPDQHRLEKSGATGSTNGARISILREGRRVYTVSAEQDLGSTGLDLPKCVESVVSAEEAACSDQNGHWDAKRNRCVAVTVLAAIGLLLEPSATQADGPWRPLPTGYAPHPLWSSKSTLEKCTMASADERTTCPQVHHGTGRHDGRGLGLGTHRYRDFPEGTGHFLVPGLAVRRMIQGPCTAEVRLLAAHAAPPYGALLPSFCRRHSPASTQWAESRCDRLCG
jgi:hypothetical protein